MLLLRFAVLLFNVVVITFLILEMVRIAKAPIEQSRKVMLIAGGVLLLLVPLGMFFRIFPPSLAYFVVYPAAISLYLFFIRRL